MMGNSHHPRDHRRKEEEQMQEAVEITQAKGRICRDIMSELSDWFTDRDVIEACAKAVETLPMFACVEADTIAGFVAKNPAGAMHHVCYEVDNIIAARDRLVAAGARVLGDGKPKTGAHGKPVLFLHPKDFLGTLVELEQV